MTDDAITTVTERRHDPRVRTVVPATTAVCLIGVEIFHGLTVGTTALSYVATYLATAVVGVTLVRRNADLERRLRQYPPPQSDQLRGAQSEYIHDHHA